MGGLMVSSVVSGRLIARTGRYRHYPIAGTALTVVGLLLPSTMGTGTSVLTAAVFMAVLGLGLGMVMQVLILAVQNAVNYRDLGVATSGTTLFRSIGGSVGVAAFGAVFSASLSSGLAAHWPSSVPLPTAAEPTAIAALAPAAKRIYLEIFSGALHPVFLSATVIATVGFALTWLLEEVPLRGPARAESVGESFAMPHDATSLEELATIITRLEARERHWDVYQRIAQSFDIPLAPDEIWLLVQTCRSGPLSLQVASERFRVPLARLQLIAEQLCAGELAIHDTQRLVATERGSALFERLVDGHRMVLQQLAAQWSPEEHAEAKTMLDGLARSLIAELPIAPAHSGSQRPVGR